MPLAKQTLPVFVYTTSNIQKKYFYEKINELSQS